MKKKILLVALLVLLLCGCEKTIPKLDNGEEAVISFKDGSMISISELYNEMKKQYGTSMLIDMVDKKILSDKYKDKLNEIDEKAKSSIETTKEYYKDEKGKLDEEKLLSDLYSALGYSSLDEYEEYLELNYLRDAAIEDYAKTQVKDSEINNYYKNNIFGDREVSHILIVPEVKDTMTSSEKEEAEQAAETKAKEVIAKLKKGEKFEDLAKEYSEDASTKDNGGKIGSVNKGTYGDDAFDNEVYSLSVGSYSKTPVKTSDGYEIIYVTSESAKKDLSEVKDEIIETLAKENISKDQKLQIDGINEVRKEYGMEIVDDEINSTYKKYMNRLYDQAAQNN